MKDIFFEIIETNGINTRIASMGEGPLVIFCHGWPESWYSYRHQLPAVAEAGFRAVAYDVRGYGESDKPHEISDYTMKLLTADVIGIIRALGYEEAITIGHDWGGPIALNTAALYPDTVTATGTLSVPYMPRSPMPILDLWKEIYKDRFFIVDYQNVLRCFSIKNGNELWKVKTENPFIKKVLKILITILLFIVPPYCG